MAFQRICRGRPPFYYMLIELEFEDDPPELTVTQFKAVLLHAFALMFGKLGQDALKIDVLKYRPSKREACVRVDSGNFVKFWSALTLITQYGEMGCAFRINQVSGHLMGLAANSRTFIHIPFQNAEGVAAAK